MECPICYIDTVSIFTNDCGHHWCKQCHQKLLKFNHTTCPMCREDIHLQKKPQHPKYMDWLVNGGAPYIWRTKRNKKRLKYLRYRI